MLAEHGVDGREPAEGVVERHTSILDDSQRFVVKRVREVRSAPGFWIALVRAPEVPGPQGQMNDEPDARAHRDNASR